MHAALVLLQLVVHDWGSGIWNRCSLDVTLSCTHTHFLTGARGKIQQIGGSAAAQRGGTSTRMVAPHNCRLSS